MNNMRGCHRGRRGKHFRQEFSRLFLRLMAAAACAMMLVACEDKNTYQEPPAPQVTTAHPVKRTVTDYIELTATLEAVASVDIRARVKGFLQDMLFVPGTIVAVDTVLFTIDPREYEATLSAARAELASARTQYERARIEHERAIAVFKQQAGAETDVVRWQAERNSAQAMVAKAEAAVTEAELYLGYTQVRSPIYGRVGRNLVDPGNLVGDGEATLLTDVVNADPIYAYFNLNERDLLRILDTFRERLEENQVDPRTESARGARYRVDLGLTTDEGYPYEGVLDFAESKVDPATGTLQLRGIFANPGERPALIPGLFARVRMPAKKLPDALLVSERVLGADQGGEFVLVVNSDAIVEKKYVETGHRHGDLRVVESGLRAEDWVIVNGLQRARPGGKVTAERTQQETANDADLPAAE